MNGFDTFLFLTVLTSLLLLTVLYLFWLFRSKFAKYKAVQLIVWNVTLFAFLLSLVFLAGEAYFRFYVNTTDSFALTKVSRKWFERYYHLNNMRARDNIDYSYSLSPGKRRITFIGDSFTIGHGIKNVEDRFANNIRRNHPELEIHVMAANGLETIDHINLVKRLMAQDYQFDLVILVYNLNDIAYILPETAELYDRVVDYEKSLGYFENNSYLINYFMARLFVNANSDLSNYYNYLFPSYFNEYWTAHSLNLLKLKATIEQAGAKLGVVTFPFFTNLKDSYAFFEVHEQLRKFWLKQKIHHLDLLSTFRSNADFDLQVNRNDPHPNELAHKLAAQEIQKYFIDNPSTQ